MQKLDGEDFLFIPIRSFHNSPSSIVLISGCLALPCLMCLSELNHLNATDGFSEECKRETITFLLFIPIWFFFVHF